MAKKRKSVTTKNTQSNKNGKITIAVAKTLQEALQHAEKNDMMQVGFEGMFYIKIGNGEWEMNDVIPDLLQFPQYKKLYLETKAKKECGEIMARDLLLVVMQANLGSRNEYDLSYLVK